MMPLRRSLRMGYNLNSATERSKIIQIFFFMREKKKKREITLDEVLTSIIHPAVPVRLNVKSFFFFKCQ